MGEGEGVEVTVGDECGSLQVTQRAGESSK